MSTSTFGAGVSKPESLESVADQLRLELARKAYATGEFRLACADLSGFTHLMASRQGLFAVRKGESRLIAHGLFFGLVTTPAGAYVFESGDLARNGGNFGRIVHLEIAGQAIVSWRILASGLSSGCHQIDIIDDRIFVVDTYDQCIRGFARDGTELDCHRPFPLASTYAWDQGYLHINSLLAVRDGILLVLHNGGRATGRPSELAVLDTSWRLVDRVPLPGLGCHNIALLDDGTVLTCASLSGEIAELGGHAMRVSAMMTRGLSVSDEGLVVGASTFSNRLQRHDARGEIVFMDAAMSVTERMPVPGAPTDIRRLGGFDRGLSAIVGGIRPKLP